ncbi:MAG: hypothetical protein NZ700_17195 [Gemmataceae bacterium]|nr:hypothetical protein [Gemmataceae bacterium]MDW8264856.1 hypothetical protein [Gemmataceae bacterium]
MRRLLRLPRLLGLPLLVWLPLLRLLGLPLRLLGLPLRLLELPLRLLGLPLRLLELPLRLLELLRVQLWGRLRSEAGTGARRPGGPRDRAEKVRIHCHPRHRGGRVAGRRPDVRRR